MSKENFKNVCRYFTVFLLLAITTGGCEDVMMEEEGAVAGAVNAVPPQTDIQPVSVAWGVDVWDENLRDNTRNYISVSTCPFSEADSYYKDRLRIKLDYCYHYPDSSCTAGDGGPSTGALCSNPYRETVKLYRNGTFVDKQQFTGSSARGSFDFLRHAFLPGTYTAEVTLERVKSGTFCLGWETVWKLVDQITAEISNGGNCFATPASGSRVRLRNKKSGKCMYSMGGSGGRLAEWGCWDDPGFVFELIDAGNQTYRIRHELTSQSIFTESNAGAEASHWIDWNDPNMRFRLVHDEGSDGYRLWHLSTNSILYTDSKGKIRGGDDTKVDDETVYYLDYL
ncbi:MAG: RICIN domain-containing protein [Deltaproteobacteria bacterium]|nr:RICIN domain-containing protein [Deltaproteobacteria bacterium]